MKCKEKTIKYLNDVTTKDCVGKVCKSLNLGDFKVLKYNDKENVEIMNFTAKQARSRYNHSAKGVPSSIKSGITKKLIEESTTSTYLYIYRSETLGDGLITKSYFNEVAKWLSSEYMGYKVTLERYDDGTYSKTNYDFRLKVEW